MKKKSAFGSRGSACFTAPETSSPGKDFPRPSNFGSNWNAPAKSPFANCPPPTGTHGRCAANAVQSKPPKTEERRRLRPHGFRVRNPAHSDAVVIKLGGKSVKKSSPPWKWGRGHQPSLENEVMLRCFPQLSMFCRTSFVFDWMLTFMCA